ncbi:MAG: type II toxin-antitoxin system VapC family toxin [Cyanobacteria bacterium J06656_5]
MRYLLDTNTCIRYLTQRKTSVERRIAVLGLSNIAICDVVKQELFYGAYKSQRQIKNLELLREFFSAVISLPFDGEAAEIAGRVRAKLSKLGTPIGPYDLQIAAIALANGLILVTHNTREFQRIQGLQLEDWEV